MFDVDAFIESCFTDSRGEPVDGLGPTDFVITEDGRRREVLRISKAVEPIPTLHASGEIWVAAGW